MLKLASRSVVIVAACALLAAGCDDEVQTPPDGAIVPKDGGTADGGGTTGDVGGTTGEAGAADVAAPGPDGATGTALTPQQARGQYLVDHVVACNDCHTPRDAQFRPLPGKYMSGVMCFIKLPNGDCLHSRNLTNDPTGLKNRSDAEIKE